MLARQNGITARSKPETVVSGDTVTWDLSFLAKYMRKMQAPCVRDIVVHVSGGTWTGTTGGLAAEDAYNVIQTININDRGGPIIDSVSGKSLRVFEQSEFGEKQVDPDTLASGVADTDYNVFVRIPFEMEKAHRGADTRVPLLHFVEGGEVSATFGTVANATNTGASARLYFNIIDERKRELKTRMVLKQRAITAVENDYDVKGLLRTAMITSDLKATAGYTALSGEASLNSSALEYESNLDTELLLNAYRNRARRALAADDEFTATARNALALWTPRPDQHIGRLPHLDSFDLRDLASVSGSRVMLTQVATNRVGSLAAEWMGFGSIAELAAAVKARGEVVGRGRRRAVGEWDELIASKLPLRLT